MGLRAVGQLGRGPADVAAQDEQVRLGVGPVSRVIEGFTDGRLERVDVVRHLAEIVHAPAVGLEALLDVVVVGQLGGPVDRDVVVVVEGDEPTQTEMAGERARLWETPSHEAAVAGHHVGVVIAHLGAEAIAHHALGDRHADRIGEALAQRPGRHLDARSVEALGMARRLAAPLTKLAQVLERQVISGQVQEGVLQDAGAGRSRGREAVVLVGPIGFVRVGTA